MLKKNDIITTEIIDYSSDGSGVARYENMVIFVPFHAATIIMNKLAGSVAGFVRISIKTELIGRQRQVGILKRCILMTKT